MARMVPALSECLAALDPGETGIVVTHGACLKVGLLGLLGWPADLAATLRGVDNCGWVTVAEASPGARLRLEAYNQQAAGPAGGGLTDL
ncbi:histidine phosphatase family protein [Nocardioides panacis]|uniref:Histidine phosphatase family protein n=1 Tax=Nocardioides panacis TaxID=2849501 RepID=A0A975XYQ4_9ACTN|nr:histidine phosphatase family protein [Nocardioides panacis]QWZ06563.1 histidine phosphatase family protein [Nocardioides panacis]